MCKGYQFYGQVLFSLGYDSMIEMILSYYTNITSARFPFIYKQTLSSRVLLYSLKDLLVQLLFTLIITTDELTPFFSPLLQVCIYIPTNKSIFAGLVKVGKFQYYVLEKFIRYSSCNW